MITKLAHVSTLVRDYDEALRWYTETLGMEKRDDFAMAEGYRWLTVGPQEQKDVAIVLHKSDESNADMVGRELGWVLGTADCQATYDTLRARNVEFTQEPTAQFYGVEAIFKDLYGNSVVIVQPNSEQNWDNSGS